MNTKRLAKFKNRDYAYEYAENLIRNKVAGQLKAVRKRRNRTQEEIAKEIGSGQPRIREFENPEYGKMSMETLFKLARALDVFLDIEFKPINRLLKDSENLAADWLDIEGFEEAVNRISLPGIIGPQQQPLLERIHGSQTQIANELTDIEGGYAYGSEVKRTWNTVAGETSQVFRDESYSIKGFRDDLFKHRPRHALAVGP